MHLNTVVLQRNPSGVFGVQLTGGLEVDSLPIVRSCDNVVQISCTLRDIAEVGG